MELQEIILNHQKNYPKWEITDVVKLIYQNEFGCGHFITNKEASLARLEAELKEQTKPVLNLFEELGNGFVRLHLNNKKNLFKPETINQIFVLSAAKQTGTRENFEKKLKLALKLCQDKLLPFQPAELINYLNEYKEQGYPPVSHSQTYRATYSPSYRVVSQKFAEQAELLLQIDNYQGKENTLSLTAEQAIKELLIEIYPNKTLDFK